MVWLISECGTAQVSLSLFLLFSCATADIVIDIEMDGLDNILPSWSSSTSTSMTMIFLTNQRPRKCDMTERHIERHKEGHFDIMTTNALRATAVKMSEIDPRMVPHNGIKIYVSQSGIKTFVS